MKSKFYSYFLSVIMLSIVGSIFAQQGSKGQPNGQAKVVQQAKHYSELFALDEAKAAQFTEMYRAYTKRMHAIRAQYHKDPPQPGTTLSDSELEKRILDNFAQSRSILNVREEYYKKFRTILSPSQINTIFEDEKARRSQTRR